MLRAALILLVSVVGVIVLAIAVGYSLPQSHMAARAISLKQKPENVFALISDFKDGASWRGDVKAVEMLPDNEGRVRFREKSANGSLTYEVVEMNPPQRIVTQIAGKDLPFGGIWIFDVLPTTDGTRLNITERGEIYNPVFRVVSRFILGYNRTLDTYLLNVSAKFGERSAPEEGRPATK